jgi:hypothetical protein
VANVQVAVWLWWETGLNTAGKGAIGVVLPHGIGDKVSRASSASIGHRPKVPRARSPDRAAIRLEVGDWRGVALVPRAAPRTGRAWAGPDGDGQARPFRATREHTFCLNETWKTVSVGVIRGRRPKATKADQLGTK